MFLAVINKSKRFSDASAQRAVAACAAQVKLHVAPMWDMVPASVVFYETSKQVPHAADLMVLLDDADTADALGYHDETPEGTPYGRAFVGPVLDQGGTPLTGSLSVSAVLSHEVCEWVGDRFVNLWADGGGTRSYAVELCDPVEEDYYEIAGVAVSNFVTKRYFDPLAPAGSQFDYMGRLSKPFSMTSGGYLLIREEGKVHQKYGDTYPEWKKALKKFPAARTARRLARAAAR